MSRQSEDAKLRDLLRLVQRRIESCKAALPTQKRCCCDELVTLTTGKIDALREVEQMIERKLAL